MPDFPDAELLLRYSRKGDRQALGELFERHAPLAYRTALAVLRRGPEAEDAVQKAFLHVLEHAPSYDPAQPFLPWFKAVVVHAAIGISRSGRRREAREARVPAPRHALEDPAMQAMDAEWKVRLRTEVDALPEDLRLPIVLHYHTGFSYAEVAASLRCAESTVASRLAEARGRLKTALATAGGALAVGVSLDDALGATAPAAAVPAHLVPTIQAMAMTVKDPLLASTAPGADRPFSWIRIAVIAAALLVVLGIGSLQITKRGFVSGTRGADSPSPSPAIQPGASPSPALTQARKTPGSPEATDPVGAGGGIPGKPRVLVPPVTGVAKVSGRILCAETGLPIRNAEVMVMDEIEFRDAEGWVSSAAFGQGHRVSGHSDEGGGFSLEFPSGRRFEVYAEAEGFLRALSAFDALQAGEDRNVEMPLSRGWGVLVKVFGPDGKPAGEAEAILEPAGGWSGKPFMEIEDPLEEAVFMINATPQLLRREAGLLGMGPFGETLAPAQVRLRVWAPGFLPQEIRNLENLPKENGWSQAEVRLQRGASLKGRVLDRNGRTVPGCGILCRPAVAMPAWEQRTTSGEDGSFILTGIPEAESALHVLACDEKGRGNMEAPLELPGGGRDGMVLHLGASGTLSGQVLDSKDDPVAGARCAAYLEQYNLPCGSTVTDSNGCFTLDGLPNWADASFRIGVYRSGEPEQFLRGSTSEKGNLHPGDRDIRIVLAIP